MNQRRRQGVARAERESCSSVGDQVASLRAARRRQGRPVIARGRRWAAHHGLGRAAAKEAKPGSSGGTGGEAGCGVGVAARWRGFRASAGVGGPAGPPSLASDDLAGGAAEGVTAQRMKTPLAGIEGRASVSPSLCLR